MHVLRKFDDSRFWQRLSHFDNDNYKGDRQAVRDLIAHVSKVVGQSDLILDQVSRFLTQYTLHNRRHILNVLAVMEALTPDDVLQQLTPLECALCILAAYTHDLGMAVTDEELKELLGQAGDTPLCTRFSQFREQFSEEVRQIDRLRELAQEKNDPSYQSRAELIEAHIRAEFIRKTHAEDESLTQSRIHRWLEEIKKAANNESLFTYGNYNCQADLERIAISHNQSVRWLRESLKSNTNPRDDDFFKLVATGERANLAFPGLLLRLADIMDFDATRTPRILFKHVGIDRDLGDVSYVEWNKHLSIRGWDLDTATDEPKLDYHAVCEHPVFEKSIREFIEWIRLEVTGVREELHWCNKYIHPHGERFRIHLPRVPEPRIESATDPKTGNPKYDYHDLQFRLDQDEIQQLLMGESLYGDPGLCIRELLQNALDALELRELRLKMKRKGEAREPVDGELSRPGWVREPDGREEELRVTLDWGTDEETGQQWLRVTDNGVGMTEEVIKNYFTQIGKSYYHSPEFNQERGAMKVAGEVVSPISIFGIGILSCFMIADRMCIKTRSARANGGQRIAHDITVSGPGSLFWLNRGTRPMQGTEITVFLKQGYRIEHDSSRCIRRARWNLGYRNGARSDSNRSLIDPVVTAMSSTVWPRYPVTLACGGDMTRRIDTALHREELAPIERDQLLQKAADWDCPGRIMLEPTWGYWDWSDCDGPDATGSRLRLWFPTIQNVVTPFEIPRDSVAHGQLRQHDLAALVESQLEIQNRTRILVRGMHISNVRECRRYSNLHGIGCRVWLDLCGAASPSLTASRQKAHLPEDVDGWHQTVEGVLRRARRALQALLTSEPLIAPSVLCGTSILSRSRDSCDLATSSHSFNLVSHCAVPWARMNDVLNLEYSTQRVRQFFGKRNKMRPSRELNRADYNACGEKLRESATLRESIIGPAIQRERLRPRRRERALESDRQMELRYWHGFGAFRPNCLASILQIGFSDDLSRSWPCFELYSSTGPIGNATLAGPGLVELLFEDDNHAVQFVDTQGQTPAQLIQRGYDLTFPMTAVPLGQLRRKCGEWRIDRWYRSLGVAPFLLPALHDVWPAHAEFLQETFQVPHIYCLLPRFELWSKCFSDWTDADWHDPENLSALWDLSGGRTGTAGKVLWARGTHHIDEMPKVGLPAPTFLEEKGNP